MTAQGPSSSLQLLAEPPQGLAGEGSRRQETAAGKGLGALAEQIREDQLACVPLRPGAVGRLSWDAVFPARRYTPYTRTPKHAEIKIREIGDGLLLFTALKSG